jgi:AcrR family transcriptional regulator
MPSTAEKTADLSPAKRRQILEGARDAFGELGFERASVDEIAARARVSKATVYNHFRDKQALFVASFQAEADELRGELCAALSREPSGGVEAALQVLGEKLLGVLVSPPIVALNRHAMAMVGRFPAVGRTLFEHGPSVGYDMIAEYLLRWQAKGALRLDDPRKAAIQFHQLCQGDLVTRARLGVCERPSKDAIRETVRPAVETFLKAYGC